MSLILAWLISMFGILSEHNAAEVQVDGWSSCVLWTSDVISARLLFKPTASLADRKWLALEMENHTLQPLKIGQTWMNLELTLKEFSSGNVLATSGLSGTFPSIKTLPPGRHRFYGDTFESASGNMGLPPVAGLRVEVQAKIDTEVTGGKCYQTPEDKPSLTFEWRYPSAAEVTAMIQEMKQHLATHRDLEKNLSRMSVLFRVPHVRESLTLEDCLPVLKATRNHNVRHLLVSHVFAKYSDAPEVLAYYRMALRKMPDVVCWDAATASVWIEEFLEPLVQGCEKGNWGYFNVLSNHSAEWRNRPPYVARVSAALFKRHPILLREARTIPDRKLEEWATAVIDAGAAANPALVELLKPALDDKRPARINLGAGGWNEGRVCDRALSAIVRILDGDSWAAFEAAGIKGWRTEEERLKVYDRVIRILKDRLKSLPVRK